MIRKSGHAVGFRPLLWLGLAAVVAHSLAASSRQPSAPLASLLADAQTAIDTGRLEEAADLLTRVLERDRRHSLARQALVDVFMRLMRWDEAQTQVDVLRQQFPKNAQIAYLAAAVAFRRGEFEQAGSLARACLEGGGDQTEAYYLLALSRFMLEDYEGFKVNLEELLKRNPYDANAHYHLGRYYYESKLYDDALESFTRATELDPQHYKAHYFRGWCQVSGGDLESSKASFRAAIQIIEREGVSYGWVFSDLGELLIKQGDYDEGLGWLYRGIRNHPELPYAHLKYASALFQKETSPEIEHHLQLAIRLDPGYAEAYYILGRYYSKVGESERAKEALAKFQELRKNPLASPQGVRR